MIRPERSPVCICKFTFMKRLFQISSIAALLLFGAANASIAQSMEKTVMVGGAAMYPSKNIIQNAVNSKDHTTLVAAVKAAGLVSTLESAGPFTVFAPTNAAFDQLPKGTVENLLKPENKATLTVVLTYHVVAGKYDSKKLMSMVKNGNVELTTVQGGKLWVMPGKKGIMLKDEKGNMAHVTIKDVYQSNGVIHVIDKVVMPK